MSVQFLLRQFHSMAAIAIAVKHISLIYKTVLIGPFSMCFLILRTYMSILTQKKSIARTLTTAIEVLLTLIRFIMTFRTQRVFGEGIWSRISHMQTSTRLLYIFYRDGTLLLIP